ncbi:hypothetical protein RD110_10905 [Rhodoferax koreense]|uniref:Uncharacterized protein n=1 Tax=Rhodoferax koreensis TaxID=1842727 RepID=A0A1P8JV33_9BURK|nr:hypothetical protein [Rhodoferax koreense]APW37636.1 hypothetical protein RD110_10905 [Rhodoferax koreense]
MTTPIKRYDLYGANPYTGMPDANLEPLGEWVRHTDHLAAVEAAVKAEREAILKELVRRERKHGDAKYTQVTEGRMWGVKEAIELISARSQPMSQPKEGV